VYDVPAHLHKTLDFYICFWYNIWMLKTSENNLKKERMIKVSYVGKDIAERRWVQEIQANMQAGEGGICLPRYILITSQEIEALFVHVKKPTQLAITIN